jgi:hypothetical protein
MKKLEKFKSFLHLLFLIPFLMGLPIKEKVAITDEEARTLIKSSYEPIINLVEDMSVTDDPNKLSIPDYISTEESFVSYLEGYLGAHTAKSIYENWITEEDGTYYADTSYFIPTIYEDSRIITKAYIKVSQPWFNKWVYKKDANIETELIIKERQSEYITTYYNRTYYYELDQDNKWFLDHVNGTSSIGFVKPSHNPWSSLWQGYVASTQAEVGHENQ